MKGIIAQGKNKRCFLLFQVYWDSLPLCLLTPQSHSLQFTQVLINPLTWQPLLQLKSKNLGRTLRNQVNFDPSSLPTDYADWSSQNEISMFWPWLRPRKI